MPLTVLEWLSLAIGALVAIPLSALAVFLLARRQAPAPAPKQTLTAGWRVGELREPTLVVRDLEGVSVPEGAHVLAAGTVEPDILGRCQVQMVEHVRMEFALAGDGTRAILFVGGARAGALALVTSDPYLLDRLDTERRNLLARAVDYVERLPISALVGKIGVTVETTGFVQDIVPFKDRFMMRLEDQGQIIGVQVERDPESLREERVQVRGIIRQEGGYPMLVAQDVRRLR